MPTTILPTLPHCHLHLPWKQIANLKLSLSPYREGIKQKICLLERQQGSPRKTADTALLPNQVGFFCTVTQCNLCVLIIRTQGATPDFRALLGLLLQRVTAAQDFILFYFIYKFFKLKNLILCMDVFLKAPH